MKEVTIYSDFKVFDDPDYCNNSPILTDSDYCPNSVLSLCRAFVNENGDPIPREFEKKTNRYKKHQQCKSAYNRALEAKKQDHCPTCGN